MSVAVVNGELRRFSDYFGMDLGPVEPEAEPLATQHETGVVAPSQRVAQPLGSTAVNALRAGTFGPHGVR